MSATLQRCLRSLAAAAAVLLVFWVGGSLDQRDPISAFGVALALSAAVGAWTWK
jgi:hypothetical protein